MDNLNFREGLTKRQKLHHFLMVDVLKRLEFDLHDAYHMHVGVPDDWEEIATRPGTPGKTRITLRIDEDVLKFFRTTGRGYQTRMNDVLRAFMQARLCSVVADGSRFKRYVDDGDDWHDEDDPIERFRARMAKTRAESKLDAERAARREEREGEG